MGANGSGKTTLIETLAGNRPLSGGRLRKGHNVQVGYLSQHSEHFGDTGTVLEAAQRATRLTPSKARALLGQFLFSGDEAEKPITGLSGGERQRLSLAILVHSGANVLILDEPTNHLDVESREALEEALEGFPGSVLLVPHDRALLDAVGSRTVAVEDGTLHSYEGGWADYLRMREERRALEEGAATAGAAADKAAAKAAKAKARQASGNGNGAAKPARSKNAVREAQKLEREIEAAEAALQALEEELADPAAWAEPERAADATERHTAAKRAVEELYARYERVAG